MATVITENQRFEGIGEDVDIPRGHRSGEVRNGSASLGLARRDSARVRSVRPWLEVLPRGLDASDRRVQGMKEINTQGKGTGSKASTGGKRGTGFKAGKDSKDSQGEGNKDSKSSKEGNNDGKGSKESKASRDSKENKDSARSKDSKDMRNSRDSKGSKGNKSKDRKEGNKESKASRGSRGSRSSKGSNGSKASTDSRDSKGSKGSNHRKDKGDKDSKDSRRRTGIIASKRVLKKLAIAAKAAVAARAGKRARAKKVAEAAKAAVATAKASATVKVANAKNVAETTQVAFAVEAAKTANAKKVADAVPAAVAATAVTSAKTTKAIKPTKAENAANSSTTTGRQNCSFTVKDRGLRDGECLMEKNQEISCLVRDLNNQFTNVDNGVLLRMIPIFPCTDNKKERCEPWKGKPWSTHTSFTLLNPSAITRREQRDSFWLAKEVIAANVSQKPKIALFREERWGIIANHCQLNEFVKCMFSVDGFTNERHHNGCGCITEKGRKKYEHLPGKLQVAKSPSCNEETNEDWCDTNSGNESWLTGGCAWKPDDVTDMLKVYREHKRRTGSAANEVVVDTNHWNNHVRERIRAFLITPACKESHTCKKHFERYYHKWTELYGRMLVVLLDPLEIEAPFKENTDV